MTPDKIGFEPQQAATGADASKLNGVTVPALGTAGQVLTVNSGANGLEYKTPAAGVTLASTTPSAVAVTSQVGSGTTAARADHIHGIPAGLIQDWGDGSDGPVTVSGTVTLTKTMNYSSLTVTSSGVLNTAGFGIYCSGTVDVQAGGVIQNNGSAASGSSAGAAAPGVRFGNGANGGLGTTTNGGSGSNASIGAGGLGGAGGAGLNGTGGAAGTVTSGVSGDTGGYLNLFSREFGQQIPGTLFRGGSGGGGGGGNNVSSGGGGGGGGGWLVIKAPTINVSGTIQANGGAGANGPGNCGGGGGGGGGVVSLIYMALTGAGTIQAAGGAAGTTGGGSGVNGSAGSAGRVLTRIIG